MKESIKTAISYIKSNYKKFKIDYSIFEKTDVHLHFPEAAIPKDGPSAGITICTGLVSIITNKKVSKDYAMTGEITLKGNVLPVGGIKEKVISSL